MIVVEGPDGGGKTTLVDALCERYHVDVVPRACTSDNGVDPATLRAWVDKDLITAAEEFDFKLRRLYDRHPLISEPIYGPLVRGRMADGFPDQEWLHSSMTVFNNMTLVIFCLPPWEEVAENIEREHKPTTDHLRGVLNNARAIYELYVYIAAGWQGHSIVWDYTRRGTHNLDLMETVAERWM